MAEIAISIEEEIAEDLEKAIIKTGLKYRFVNSPDAIVVITYDKPIDLYKLGINQAATMFESLQKSNP